MRVVDVMQRAVVTVPPGASLKQAAASAGKQPIQAERAVNAAIAAIARTAQTIVLEPDFEAVAGLRGHSHKPEHAWRSFAGIEREQVPPPLATAAERVLALARD